MLIYCTAGRVVKRLKDKARRFSERLGYRLQDGQETGLQLAGWMRSLDIAGRMNEKLGYSWQDE